MAINNNKGAKLREIFGCVCVPTPPTPPLLPPTGEIDLNVTSGSAILTWTYTDTNQDGFNVEKSTDGDVYNPLITLNTPSLRTYTDSDVSGGYTYWYRLNAYNTAGTSSYSNTSSIYFNGPPIVPVSGHLLAAVDGFLPADIDITNIDILNTYSGIIDLTGNNYTFLAAIDCTNLTTLYCGNYLTSLNVSNNTALTHLDCNENYLTSLNVSGSTALEYLDCDDNNLTSLDVSTNTALTHLDFGSNYLTSIDISNNTALQILVCFGGSLTSLNVSSNTALTDLTCAYNNSLTSLDVSNNTALTTLYCVHNNLADSSLIVSGAIALENLYCFNNSLTSLDVSTNTELITLDCQNNLLTQVAVDNILASLVANGKSGFRVRLNGTGNSAPTDLTNVNILLGNGWQVYVNTPPPTGLIDLISVTSGSAILDWTYTDTNQDGFNVEKSTDGDVYNPLTTLSNPSLRTYTDNVVSGGNTYWYRLNAYNTVGTSSYSNTGSIYFAAPAVPHLLAYNGASLIFDYTDNVISSSYNGIINITSSNLTSVTASNCIHLTYLNAGYNPLSSVNVSGAINLETLWVGYTSDTLSTLDLSTNTALKSLDISANNFSSLDITNNVNLEGIGGNNNSLTSLDISNNVSMSYLDLAANALTQPAVDDILQKLVAHGVIGGELHFNGGSNAIPSSYGLGSDYYTLKNTQNWTITPVL